MFFTLWILDYELDNNWFYNYRYYLVENFSSAARDSLSFYQPVFCQQKPSSRPIPYWSTRAHDTRWWVGLFYNLISMLIFYWSFRCILKDECFSWKWNSSTWLSIFLCFLSFVSDSTVLVVRTSFFLFVKLWDMLMRDVFIFIKEIVIYFTQIKHTHSNTNCGMLIKYIYELRLCHLSFIDLLILMLLTI